MRDESTALTDEELALDQPEDLRSDDGDARPAEDFLQQPLDTDIVNSSRAVEEVLDDEDVANLDGEPPTTPRGAGS